MQPHQIVELIRKWFLLIVLAALLGAAAGLAVNHFLPKKYQASTTVFVNSPNNIDYNSLLGAQQAAKAFTSFPQSQPILEEALQIIGDNSLSETQLAKMVSVENDLDSQYVIIQVNDSNPVRAARLASTITSLAINQFQGTVINGTNTKFLKNEVSTLQNQIYSQEQELTTLQSQPASPTQAAQMGQVSANLNELRQQYSQDLINYQDLTSIQIVLLQDAQVPQQPVGLGAPLSMAIGLLIGLIAITAVIIVIEQTDDVLRTPEKVDKASGLTTFIILKQSPDTIKQLPWLNSYEPGRGVVVTVKPVKALSRSSESQGNKGIEDAETSQQVSLMSRQASSTAHMNGSGKTNSRFELPESFLALGVLFKSDIHQRNKPGEYGQSLLITSPENGDGKTVVASQLALGMARVGVRVVLIDSNLRNPHIHKIFGVANRVGLSTILYTDKMSDMTGVTVDSIGDVLQPTPEPNLAILPSGPVVDAAPVLLSSARMGNIIDRLSRDAFVIIDSPAVLTTSEAMILASKSGSILMVVNAQHTTSAKLNQSLGMLSHMRADVRGVVLNQVGKSSRV